jgi:hypothetical protein
MGTLISNVLTAVGFPKYLVRISKSIQKGLIACAGTNSMMAERNLIFRSPSQRKTLRNGGKVE